MAIRFVCSCGKHLRARDEMAARRTACPACGAPVGIPSLEPTHRGGVAAPLSPAERLAHRRAAAPAARDSGVTATTPVPGPAVRPLPDAAEIRVVTPRRRQRGPGAGVRWGRSLLYALRAGWLSALVLTGLTGVALLAWPTWAEARHEPAQWLVGGAYLLVLLLFLCYPCGLCEFVLLSAAGEGGRARWPGGDLRRALRSGGVWGFCFLAGPVVPAAGAPLYWLDCGDPAWPDWLIVGELAAVALGYWLLAVVAVTRGGRLVDANPVRVAELAHALGYRTALAVLAASGLALAFARLAVAALEESHASAAGGCVLLACFWVGAVTSAILLFGVLGVWCRRVRLPA
jgi:hypothetical protein